MDSLYSDILISNGDVILDGMQNPELVTDRACIAQDIIHAIIESRLALKLVGLRGAAEQDDIIQQIKIIIENDPRIRPGTAQYVLQQQGQWLFTARTKDFEVQLWI